MSFACEDHCNTVFVGAGDDLIVFLRAARPIYSQTSSGGHFGRNLPDFTWEKTDYVQKLRKAAGL
jgi:S-adenosylmethionine synthetase